ncbi:MAG: penicillin acylase family protein [Pseudomonadales bacterium]
MSMTKQRRWGVESRHRTGATLAALLMLAAAGCSPVAEPVAEPVAAAQPALPGQGDDAGRTVIYRDSWGVPHIYAGSVAAGFYAMGYAQAQDRPDQLLLNLKIALGELAAVAGESQVPQDLIARLFDHKGIAERQWPQMSEQIRARLGAFADGVNEFYRQHPEDVPAWWGERPVTPQMVAAFGRMFLYNWSIDEALNDLRRGGIDPGVVSPRRASNQWVVAPERSASGHGLLYIDPHLSWWGPSRFWEVRIHAGELSGSGVTLAGNPYIGLGHNQHLAWAMTTGGPDTGDIYRLTLNPDDPEQYRYDGAWRRLEQRIVTLQVNGVGERQYTLKRSHHGPVVASGDGVAYAARIPYDEQANPMDVWEALNFAESYQGVVAAGETLAMFPQNLMAADTAGNIYYQRSGRVPVRPAGFDFSSPVDGSTSSSEWQGVHPASDLLQVLNPPQGYMQNCNVPPDAMMVDSPFSLSAQPEYLFSSANYGPSLAGWTNQRGARALELLTGNGAITVDQALDYAVDLRPHGIDRWLAALAHALPEGAPERALAQPLLEWDGQLQRDSVPALRYAYWRMALAEHADARAMAGAIDDHYAVVEGRPAKPLNLGDAEANVLAATFATGMARMHAELGTVDAPGGRVFRVGRGDASWPVGGGGGDQYGLTTLRTMGYDAPNERFERWGSSGQTSTQIVELATPIRSWGYLPVGQSDRPESPHYTDQAERVFSERRLKPSWWLPEDLAGNVQSRTVLENAP